MEALKHENKGIWIVIDENGYPIYCAGWPEACHEHINDAINNFQIEDAEKWKVREAKFVHDERTGKPLVTSAMKADCIGEFTFTRQNACVECYEVANENCDVCGGEIDYIETITVPWGTCKEIYKAMAVAAGKEVHNAK